MTLTPAEQEAIRAELAAQRDHTTAQIAGLTRDFDGIVEASQLVAADDEHDPDGSTIAFERAQVSALLQHVLANLAALDEAEERLRNGTYGVCDSCGQPLDFERLLALPTTRTCVSCAAGSGPFLRRS